MVKILICAVRDYQTMSHLVNSVKISSYFESRRKHKFASKHHSLYDYLKAVKVSRQ